MQEGFAGTNPADRICVVFIQFVWRFPPTPSNCSYCDVFKSYECVNSFKGCDLLGNARESLFSLCYLLYAVLNRDKVEDMSRHITQLILGCLAFVLWPSN